MEIQSGFRELLALFNKHNKQFISNKRATGRKKDIADLEALGEE
jgi:hypothetical protein